MPGWLAKLKARKVKLRYAHGDLVDLYIDACPVEQENHLGGTLCLILIRAQHEQTLMEIAPPSRNELEAKYFALERGLEALMSLAPGDENLRIFTDCWMLVNQLEGKYDVKDPGFQQHKSLVEELRAKLGRVEVRYVPKRENLAHAALEESLRMEEGKRFARAAKRF